jgi:IS5 family transposase
VAATLRPDRAFYPRSGNGRPPVGLERMLRLHCLQHWFNLSDPAAEESLYDSLCMRRFVGIDLGREPVPDETTILNFRHLLERHNLGNVLFDRVNEHLASRGMKVAGGTIVDATIIAALSSTKNAARARDPEMHQTRKGQQWYFGASCCMATRPGCMATRRIGDSRQRSARTRRTPMTNQRYRHRGVVDEAERGKNRTKSGVRAKVEYPFGVIKRVFGFAKVRYRGLAKNTQRTWVSCNRSPHPQRATGRHARRATRPAPSRPAAASQI